MTKITLTNLEKLRESQSIKILKKIRTAPSNFAKATLDTAGFAQCELFA